LELVPDRFDEERWDSRQEAPGKRRILQTNPCLTGLVPALRHRHTRSIGATSKGLETLWEIRVAL
jgi:hypothetical protein